MILIALLIGAILIVAAVRNSQGALFSALGTDVPGFVVWAAAIVALGIIGYIPGLKPVSRGLLALVLLVIVLKNYQQILSSFQSAWQHPQPSGSNSGGSSFIPGGGSGGGAGASGSWSPTSAVQSAFSAAGLESGFGGSSVA